MAKRRFKTRNLQKLADLTVKSLVDELASMDPKEKVSILNAIMPYLEEKQGTRKPKSQEEAPKAKDPIMELMRSRKTG